MEGTARVTPPETQPATHQKSTPRLRITQGPVGLASVQPTLLPKPHPLLLLPAAEGPWAWPRTCPTSGLCSPPHTISQGRGCPP